MFQTRKGKEVMKITHYEIDLLSVGAADACLLHFFDDDNNESYTVLIDAGNYSDGKKVSDFIKLRYPNHFIDLAICTHCDADHFGGFIYLLEQMDDNVASCITIGKMLVNDPGNHVSSDEVKRYRLQTSVEKEAREVFSLDDGRNLFDMLDKTKVLYEEAFSDSNYSHLDNHIEIVAPTEAYYEQLVYSFRNNLQAYDDGDFDSDDAILTSDNSKVYSPTLDKTPDDASAHNQSSIMVLFKPDDGKKYLFMGDAGREAFANLNAIDKNSIANVTWLKVPHHGSKHNMSNEMINHIRPEIAYISAEKYGKYISQAIVSALKKAGSKVYSTHKNGNLWHYNCVNDRDDYSSATPL